MSLLKQIDDKGAVLAWSPLAETPNLVALGTKDSSGIGFDDHGGELELHSLDFKSPGNYSTTLFGSCKTSARFSSIAWSRMANFTNEFSHGLIAGGMADGILNVWDPSKLAAGDDALLASVEQHQGAVSAVHFNPHAESSHLLATGGSDAEIYVISLDHPDNPSVFIPAPPPNNAKHTADITQIAWNTQVAHILASSAQNGSCFVWDLRQKRSWCELRDPSGGSIADIAWNPDQGLNIITASGDDKNPVLKLWDLRSSTSLPLATLQGHTQGILSVSWCPFDTSLLLSSGKDNRTILWDLFNLQPIYELPSKHPGDDNSLAGAVNQQANVFGGLATSASQRRYNVSWSPILPAVVSASSFDRSIQFYSLSGVPTKATKAPKWLRRPVGAVFGFGGKLAVINNTPTPSSSAAAGNNKKGPASTMKLQIYQVAENPELIASSDVFHDAVTKGTYKELCELRAANAISEQSQQTWNLMKVICFGTNAREELLTFLGFDSQTISTTAEAYLSQANAATVTSTNSVADATAGLTLTTSDDDAAASVFDALPSPGHPAAATTSAPTSGNAAVLPPLDLSNLTTQQYQVISRLLSSTSLHQEEVTIRRALIVGNFELAVECCLQAGLLAEALLLAQCGGQELRVKTQAVYFEKQRHVHPFLNLLHAVIKNKLLEYVLSSDLSNWKETLASLSTYGKSDEFGSLCEALATRLESELHDRNSAALCFMCAANVSRVIAYWTEELKEANRVSGQLNTVALRDYVEKVLVFTHANPIENLSEECGDYFSRYAELLASQGKLNNAMLYLKGNSVPVTVLVERLYQAGNKPAGSRPPPFPFTRVAVECGIITSAPSSSSSAFPATAATNNPTATAAMKPQQVTSAAPFDPSKAAAKPATATAASSSSAASKPQNHPALQAMQMQQQQQQQQHQQASNMQQSFGNMSVAAGGPSNVAGGVPMPPAVSRAPEPQAPTLPPGWLQLHDPSSNRFYYVDQATGASQWEPPAMVMAPPAPVPTPMPPTPQAQYPAAQSEPSMSAPGPYGTAPGPGPGPVATVTPAVAPTPVITTAVIDSDVPLNGDCIIAIGQLIEAVAAVVSAPAEKKQVQMLRAAYQTLHESFQARKLNSEIMGKLTILADALSNRNYPQANLINTDLVNTAWNQHKEWIKGLKILIQLASKK